MRRQHWWLRGWEYEEQLQPNGSTRRVLVYKGEYYRVARGTVPLAGIKCLYILPAAVLWVLMVLMLTHFSRGAYLFFVGGACGISLIPAIYLAIGCVRLVRTPERMTYRDLHDSFDRIRTSAKWIRWLMLVCLAGEAFYLIFRGIGGYPIDWPAESLWLAGGAVGVAVPLVHLGLLKRFRIELLPMTN